ncbi:MAG TPA: hypothetical protein VNA14_09910 [Mycobacteriales bacterium]|nr:hypothetical protein [Mycobacteriales bacterium]
MRPSTLPTAARTAAAVLATLAAIAGFNTAYVIGYAARHDPGAGLVLACVASVAITVALAYAAVRLWRRGASS